MFDGLQSSPVMRRSFVLVVGLLLLVGCSSSSPSSDEASKANTPPAASTSSPSPPPKDPSTNNPSNPATPSGDQAFGVVKNGNNYVATSKANASIVIEVDCDDGKADGHDYGITPILNGRRLDAFMWDAKFGFLVPDADAGPMKCVKVESDSSALTVLFEAGSYRTLNPAAPDKPVPLLAVFRLNAEGKLTADVSGLYYMMPSKRNTRLEIGFKNQSTMPMQTRTVTQSAGASIEYFDDVARLLINDADFGVIQVETDIKRLQVEVFGTSPQLEFELDLDHSFKDAGQESVPSKITFLN
jgi:hypothetical protein